MTSVPQPATLKKPRRWAGFETFGSIFGFAYTFLAGNVLLALANAPLVLFLGIHAAGECYSSFFISDSESEQPSLG